MNLVYVPVTETHGLYFDDEYQSPYINLSQAIDEFAPTYEDMELLKESLVENMQHAIDTIKKKNPTALTQDEFNEWYKREFGVGVKRMTDDEYAALMRVKSDLVKLQISQVTEQPRRAVKRIVQRQQYLLKPSKPMGGVTDEQIERAREHPIEDLLGARTFKATGRWRSNTHCPMPDHAGERTPSFFIDKKNKFKCFGCQAKGDSIAFIMQRDGVDFITAVKSLI